jgi:putative ABC transport system permease protein
MLVEDQPMQVYVPVAQTPLRELTLVVRSGAAVADVLNTIKTVVGELHPGAAVAGAATMNERLASSVAAPRLNSALLAAFAAVAVVLTAIGVYGVMGLLRCAADARDRHPLALGAQKLDVLRLVVGHSIRLIAFSIVAGAILTALTLPWLQALLARADR